MNNESTPLVSVVLPTHNRTELLPRSIGSVLNQSYDKLELIVVDDGSSENIQAVTDGFNDPRVRCIRRDACGGPAAARNTGLNAAVGEYVTFQDSDDEWLPDKLERQMAYMTLHPDLALVSCGLLRQDASNDFVFPTPVQLETGFVPGLRQNLIAFTQTWLARRSQLLAAGGFDESLRIWDDWDLLYRVALGAPCAYLKEYLVVSHVTPGSVGSDVGRRIHDIRRFIDKYAQHDQALQARMLYLLGRFQLLQADRSDARRHLTQSLRIYPGELKCWLALALGLLPTAVARRLLEY